MIARRKATLAELSRELGISRERVRQVQKEAENSSRPGSTPAYSGKLQPEPANCAPRPQPRGRERRRTTG
jgi:hypothetical protein